MTEPTRPVEDPRAAAARCRELVGLMSEGVWNVDADGRTTLVNPALAEIVGSTVDEMLGRSLFDFIATDRLPDAAAQVARWRGGATEHHQFQLVDSRGTPIGPDLRTAPLFDDAGDYQGALGVISDPTEERHPEDRYRALVQNSLDIVTVLEPDGRWRWSSAAGTRVLGYTEDFAADANIFSLLHPDDVETALRALDEVTRGARGSDQPVLVRVRAADGSWRHLETVASNLVDDPAVRGIVLDSRDVTDRIEIEQELQANERRFRAVIQHGSDVVTIAQEDGVIVYTSPAMERVLGYAPDELIGSQTRDLMHPDDVARVEQAVGDQFFGVTPEAPIEYRVRHRNGSWRTVEGMITNLLDEPGIHGVVGTNRDITERVEAEAALRRTQERFQALVQHASDLISIADEDGIITYISPSVRRLLGYEPHELVGTGRQLVIDPDDVPRVVAAIVDELDPGADPGADPRLVVYRARHRDGSWRVLEGVTTNLLHEPTIAGFVTNARDVTERHAAERKAAQLTEVLDRSNEVVVLSDPSGSLVYANQRARDVFRLGDEAEVGALSSVASRDRLRTEIMPFVRRHGLWTGELALRATDGTEFPVLATIQAHRENDEIVLVSTIAHDITELKKRQNRLQHEVTHDQLTGLPNRVLFNEVAEQALGRAARHHATTAVMFLDLDGFKGVNDSLGHDAGDRLLIEVARRLRVAVRTGDLVARIGGDEFCVLCERVDGETEALDLARRLIDAVSIPLRLDGRDVQTGTSIGLALDASGEQMIGSLVRDADVALYRAKHNGRGRVELFSPPGRLDAASRLLRAD